MVITQANRANPILRGLTVKRVGWTEVGAASITPVPPTNNEDGSYNTHRFWTSHPGDPSSCKIVRTGGAVFQRNPTDIECDLGMQGPVFIKDLYTVKSKNRTHITAICRPVGWEGELDLCLNLATNNRDFCIPVEAPALTYPRPVASPHSSTDNEVPQQIYGPSCSGTEPKTLHPRAERPEHEDTFLEFSGTAQENMAPGTWPVDLKEVIMVDPETPFQFWREGWPRLP